MSQASPPVGHGDIVGGKYRIEQLLGSGGMGHVVSAVHVQLDQRVAIKFMRDEHLNDGDAVKRFEREARAASRLKSMHAARVVDVGTLDSGSPYMVMELLEGVTLRALMKQRGRLECEEAAALIAHACEAIAEAHSLGLVHRDVKPTNLFITRTATGKPLLKVLDFGIVKAIDADATNEEATLTKTHVPVGSPKYMAPEQVTSSKTVDRRADVWGLGACLFEMTTGQAPFRADNLLELGAKIVHEPVAEVRNLRPDMDPELSAIIHRCLQKNPDHRYADAGELARALEDYVGRPTSSPRMLSPLEMTTTPSAPMVAATPVGFAPPPPALQRVDDTGGSRGTNVAWGETAGRRPTPHYVAIGLAASGLVAVIGSVLVVLAVRGRNPTTTHATPASASVAIGEPAPPITTPVPPPVAAPVPSPEPAPAAQPAVAAAPTVATPATAPSPSPSPAPAPSPSPAAAPIAPPAPPATTATAARTSPPATPPRPPVPRPTATASHRAFDHL